MRRLLPRTMAGQLVALLLGALVVTQAVAAFVFIDERRHALHGLVHEQVLMRTVGMVRLLEETSPGSHRVLLRAVGSPILRFRLQDAPEVEVQDDDPLAESLRVRMLALLDGTSQDVRVAVPASSWWDHARRAFWRPGTEIRRHRGELRRERIARRTGMQQVGREAGDSVSRRVTGLNLSIAMPDGRWLNVASSGPAPPRGWGYYGLLTLGLFGTLVIVIVIVTVRRIARPMQGLAVAAEAFGRGAQQGPLPETGPEEVRRATQAFNRMRERIDRFVQDRTRMLAAISHDLRTPITSLRIRAEFVEDEALRARMLESLDEMQHMTEETLAFLREEASQEPTRAVDLCALVGSLCDDLRDIGHDVTVRDCEKQVCACRAVALKRAIDNVVMNAVRYGERARVSVGRDGSELVVTVDDDGPGIAAENLERVFEPFVRLEESRSTETGGLGLGLAIARSIIRAHGGEITLANRPEGGLRVQMRLPAEK
jgi:signal transduction histidine kinase